MGLNIVNVWRKSGMKDIAKVEQVGVLSGFWKGATENFRITEISNVRKNSASLRRQMILQKWKVYDLGEGQA